MQIKLEKIRELLLTAPLGHRPYLSAASGLTGVGNSLFVVADDELSLGIFPLTGNEPGRLFPIFPGGLSTDPIERKRKKPDLEALALFRPALYAPRGALLALPSGSTSARFMGALLPFGQTPEVPALARPVDFSELYSTLGKNLPELNIEGALPVGDEFWLFQRGNGPSGENALIRISLDGILKDLHHSRPPKASHIRGITLLELGKISGVPLSVTDAALCGKGDVWFLAAAEAGASTYDDGKYYGSVLGQISAAGKVINSFPLKCPEKAEGLWIPPGSRDFFVVTDADQPNTPGCLYKGTLPS